MLPEQSLMIFMPMQRQSSYLSCFTPLENIAMEVAEMIFKRLIHIVIEHFKCARITWQNNPDPSSFR